MTITTTMKGRWRIKMWNSQVAWRPTVNLAPHHVTFLSSSIIISIITFIITNIIAIIITIIFTNTTSII